MAYSLNCPLYATCIGPQKSQLPGAFSMISVDTDNVMIEAVKQAEGDKNLIVRLYEYKNRRSNVSLHFGKPFVTVDECDLMENELQPLQAKSDSFSFEIKPYEIKTLKICFDK